LPNNGMQKKGKNTGHLVSRNCLIFSDRGFDSSIVMGDPAVPKQLATSRVLAFPPHPVPSLAVRPASEPVVTACAV
jgi:hypothetical protein